MTFTIAHLSDPHLGPVPMPKLNEWTTKRFMGFVNWKRGRERSNDMAMLSNLVADLRAQSPDHVAMTGDAVNIGLPAEFGPAVAWMRTLGPPEDVSLTPGNHDAYVRGAMPHLMSAFAPWTRSDNDREGPWTFPFLRVRRDVALIGLCSGVPTGPLMATGRLGSTQLARLASMLDEAKERELARVIMIHHPPLTSSASSMRSLTDAREFERIVGLHGAELVLHGHNHRRLVRFLASSGAQNVGGRIPVIGVQSASSTSRDLNQRAAYHLLRLRKEGRHWTIAIRARGLMRNSQIIGEREPVFL
jgi:3',5'-cyclic AMP phosphodiesterase CpdA